MDSMLLKSINYIIPVKKLIDGVKLPFINSLYKQQLPLMKVFNINPLKCDKCGDILKYECSYNY